MKTLRIKTARRTQLVDITREVEHAVRDSGVKQGLCYVYVPHTTAGVAINEHADPDVASDVEGIFDALLPHESDSHGHQPNHLYRKRQTRSRYLAGRLPLRIRWPAAAQRLRQNRR